MNRAERKMLSSLKSCRGHKTPETGLATRGKVALTHRHRTNRVLEPYPLSAWPSLCSRKIGSQQSCSLTSAPMVSWGPKLWGCRDSTVQHVGWGKGIQVEQKQG